MNVVTTDEAAEILEVSPEAVRKLVARGKLRAIRPGARPLRFHEGDVWRLRLNRVDQPERERRQRLATQWASLV